MSHLDDLAVFIQVVERGSFTAAATHLELSKAVVSKYVTRLEHHLGVRLLNRTTRRLSLTEAGRLLFERGKRGLHEIEEAQHQVRLLQEEPRGTLRLNAPMSFGMFHVAPAIPDFLAQYPDVSIDLNLDDRLVDMVEEGYDLSIRISHLTDSSLVARRLGPCHHLVVGSPEYLAKHGVPNAPQDLRDHDILSYRYQTAALDWVFETDKGHSLTVGLSSRVRINNSLAIREALLGGMGLARIPTFVVGKDIREGRLQAVLTGFRLPTLPISLVYPIRRHPLPKVRAFIEFMQQRITNRPYWDRLRKEVDF